MVILKGGVLLHIRKSQEFCYDLVILGADLVDDFVNFWSLPYSSDPSETRSKCETVSLIGID